VIFFASTILIWTFVIMCYSNPEYFQAFFAEAQTSVTVYMTWAYMGTQQIWAFFLI